MEFLAEYGLFLDKTVTFILAFLLLVGSLVSAGSKLKKAEKKGHIDIERLNDHYEEMKEVILESTQSPDEYKKHLKEKKKQEKENAKIEKKRVNHEAELPAKRRIFVIDFYGDIKASETSALEQLVSAIICVATPQDEVLLKLDRKSVV